MFPRRHPADFVIIFFSVFWFKRQKTKPDNAGLRLGSWKTNQFNEENDSLSLIVGCWCTCVANMLLGCAHCDWSSRRLCAHTNTTRTLVVSIPGRGTRKQSSSNCRHVPKYCTPPHLNWHSTFFCPTCNITLVLQRTELISSGVQRATADFWCSGN